MSDNETIFPSFISTLRRQSPSSRHRQHRNTHPTRLSFLKRCGKTVSYAGLALAIISITLVAIFRYAPPPTSAFMLQTQFEDLIANQRYRPIKQTWVNKRQISPHAFLAVIASEDQRFYRHHGFDMAEIYRAYQQYRRGGKLRGASTISQQVAKNLFLNPSKNMLRKAAEVWFTFLLESLWPKDRILEVYLNIAEFGDHLFGIEAASKHYFGIPAKQLSASQAALLAATLPNPKQLKPRQPSPYLLRRQAWILVQMRNLKR